MKLKDNPKQELNSEKRLNTSKPYSEPKIIFEIDLETKAGSPIDNSDPDPFLPGFGEPEN
jgi:hypothetical protein